MVECVLEDIVHYGSAADPQFLASGRQDVGQILLVPSGRLLARKSYNQLEMLRVELVQQTQHPQAARLFFVEVCHVVSEFEVVLNYGSLLFVHFAHHEASYVC